MAISNVQLNYGQKYRVSSFRRGKNVHSQQQTSCITETKIHVECYYEVLYLQVQSKLKEREFFQFYLELIYLHSLDKLCKDEVESHFPQAVTVLFICK